MATFGSNGIVLKETKTLASVTNLSAGDNAIYTVPAGRYAEIDIINLELWGNNTLKVVNGVNSYLMFARKINQTTDPMRIGVLNSDYESVGSGLGVVYQIDCSIRPFMLRAGDILTIQNVSSALNSYLILIKEYLLP